MSFAKRRVSPHVLIDGKRKKIKHSTLQKGNWHIEGVMLLAQRSSQSLRTARGVRTMGQPTLTTRRLCQSADGHCVRKSSPVEPRSKKQARTCDRSPRRKSCRQHLTRTVREDQKSHKEDDLIRMDTTSHRGRGPCSATFKTDHAFWSPLYM